MKYDIAKIEKQFSLFKIKNKHKTLKDFCTAKKLNYAYISKKIKTKKVSKIKKIYSKEKEKSFMRTLKIEANKKGYKDGLDFVSLIIKLDTIFHEVYNRFIKLSQVKKNSFKSCMETIKALSYIVNSISDLHKLRIIKQSSTYDNELEKEEDRFFIDLLNSNDITKEKQEKEKEYKINNIN